MKRCSVGGQAVLKGVMMRTPEGGVALAVRKSDGSIVTEFTQTQSKAKKGTFLGWPVVRGVVAFVEALSSGMKLTTRSAELYGEQIEEEPGKFEKWLAKKCGKSVMDVATGIAVVLAIVLSLGLFVFLPSFISQLIPWSEGTANVVKSLVEGGVRLLIFIGYLCAISAMKDIRRVFMYHGAEHKTIACYEHEAEVTPQNAMRYSRLHPRCGTNYLFLVMAVSILFFALIYTDNFFLRFLSRLVFIPVVAGLAYELLRFAGKYDNLAARIVRAPGMALQYLTTREPTEDMLEVAITAFDLAMHPPEGHVIKTIPKKGAEQPPKDAARAGTDETAESAAKTELKQTAGTDETAESAEKTEEETDADA